MKKKYYIIYHNEAEVRENVYISEPFCIVEDKSVAEDFCSLSKEYYYIEREVKKYE